jgi:hypothetical protein
MTLTVHGISLARNHSLPTISSFVVITYVNEDLIFFLSYFHVDLLLMLLPDPFILFTGGMLYSNFS